jgi:hypothetical protein
MKSIITTYPDFQSLPRGIKMMLLVSEDHFFSEVKSHPASSEATRQTGGLTIANPDPTNPLHSVHRPFQ